MLLIATFVYLLNIFTKPIYFYVSHFRNDTVSANGELTRKQYSSFRGKNKTLAPNIYTRRLHAR